MRSAALSWGPIRDETLDGARCLFFDRGHDLAQAAVRLGGASGEARVVSCGVRLQAATQMAHCIRKDLQVVHRLFSLADVGNPERVDLCGSCLFRITEVRVHLPHWHSRQATGSRSALENEHPDALKRQS